MNKSIGKRAGGLMSDWYKLFTRPKQTGRTTGYAIKGIENPEQLAEFVEDLNNCLAKAVKGNWKRLEEATGKYIEAMESNIPNPHKLEINRKFREYFDKIKKKALANAKAINEKTNHKYVESACRYFIALYHYDPESKNKNTVDAVIELDREYDGYYPATVEGYEMKGDFQLYIYDFKKELASEEPEKWGHLANYSDLIKISVTYGRAADKVAKELRNERHRLIAKSAYVYAREDCFHMAMGILEMKGKGIRKIPRIEALLFISEELEREGKIDLAIEACKRAVAVFDSIPSDQYRKDKAADRERMINRISALEKRLEETNE